MYDYPGDYVKREENKKSQVRYWRICGWAVSAAYGGVRVCLQRDTKSIIQGGVFAYLQAHLIPRCYRSAFLGPDCLHGAL